MGRKYRTPRSTAANYSEKGRWTRYIAAKSECLKEKDAASKTELDKAVE